MQVYNNVWKVDEKLEVIAPGHVTLTLKVTDLDSLPLMTQRSGHSHTSVVTITEN